MAIGAADAVRSMWTSEPIPNVRIAGVATQTDAIGIIGGTLFEGDDLGNISAALHVQTAGTMALLAFDALLSVKRVAEIFGNIGVTRSTSLGAHRSCPLDLDVPSIRGDCILRFLGCNYWKADDYNKTNNYEGEDSGRMPH